MGRGRRKTATAILKCLTEKSSSTSGQPLVSHQKSRGKLAETNPTNLITEYFDVKETAPTPNSSQKKNEGSPHNSLQDSLIAADNVSRKVLRDTNSQLGSSDDRLSKASSSDRSVTIKTETSVPLSPSTALSRLNIVGTKKQKKPKSRLLIKPETVENVQKTITQFFPIRRSGRKSKKTVLEEKKREIEEAVLSKREDGLQVKIFEGKGRGVIATRHFTRGEFVVEYAGELISMPEAEKREATYARNDNIGCYMYYFKHRDSHHCVDATAESGRMGRLLNHSRNGNLMTKTIEVNGVPRLVLLAREDIMPGCELTYDYGDRSKQSLMHHPWLAHSPEEVPMECQFGRMVIAEDVDQVTMAVIPITEPFQVIEMINFKHGQELSTKSRRVIISHTRPDDIKSL